MKKLVCSFDELLESENLILESFETAINKFAAQPFMNRADVVGYVEDFKKFRGAPPKSMKDEIPGVSVPVERRHDISSYKSFKELKKVVDL